MAFDPIQEDCLRLILAQMKRDRIYPLDDADYIERVMLAYQNDAPSLIKTDRDRSFHLVCRATELIDYRTPFLTTEDEVNKLIERTERYLSEAVRIDEGNWDAKRMLATVQSESDDELVSYLLDNREAVAADAKRLIDEASDPYAREFANDLGQRPYQRWLAALASRLFIAGQYRRALDVVGECLTVAPLDWAGVRHTGMLALAKLEVDRAELQEYRARHALAYQTSVLLPLGQRTAAQSGAQPRDAWSLIAEMSLAYRDFDYEGATRALRELLRVYPRGAQALYFQAEFPEGVFSRVHVAPGSEDELVIALSEATPLLQEGMGTPDAASFALWIADHELVQQAISEQDRQMREQAGGMAAGGGA